MPKTHRIKNSNNKTKKCPVGLKPFEKNFSLVLAKNEKKLNNIETYKKAEFARELLARFAPSSLEPYNDFYDYINYLWLKNVSLEKQQKYIVQIDDFRLAQDKVYRELNKIIVDYFTNNNNRLAKNIKNYYNSIINMNPKPYTKKLAYECVKKIDDLINGNNPWELLAFLNSDEMISPHAPLSWVVNPDNKEPNICRSYINSAGLILIDLNVYYDDGTDVEYKKKYRKAYEESISKIFKTLFGKNDYNPNDPFDVEVEIFNALGCLDVSSKDSIYNRVTKKDSIEKYGFDWEEFTKHLGYKKTPDFYITTNLNYLKCGTKLFIDNWKTPKWRTYYIYLLLRRLIRITRDWEKIIFDFQGLFERGQQEINDSPAVSSALYMTIPFNKFLTDQYVNKFENPQAMEYTKTLCDDLKYVFKRILTRNKWLQPSTKKYALKKLDHFKFIYGKPEDIPDDPDLDYGTLLYDNMKKVIVWRHYKSIALDGKKPIEYPVVDWTQYPVKMTGTQAYIVNASYTPSKNAIYINLGYIQKPFIDLDERGIEYNLAHLGFTIGHEMSHGFDDWGSQYGYDGKLLDWWTEKDKKHYKKIQQDVIKQYEEFAARDGIKFDASIGIGEDLADISGMAICDEYLRDFQDKNQDLIPIRALSYEAFYTYFAFQQKQYVGKKAISAQLKTNPHPLDKYRCNIPISRSDIFRALYDVKKGDGMWWHNTNTVWS
jgi:predicted metalloendopeptidase